MVTPAGFEGFWRESAQLQANASAHVALARNTASDLYPTPTLRLRPEVRAWGPR
jgi:hypothetical protein